MYPKAFTKKMDMYPRDSGDAEQLAPVADSSAESLPENNLIAVTADYDEKYIDRKPKFLKTQQNDLIDSGFKLKKKFTLSEMYVRTPEKQGNNITSIDNGKSINDNYPNDHMVNGKRKIKILFDDIENNIMTTNANESKSGIKSDEWEPIAYDGLDSIPVHMYSTKITLNTESTPISWESLHYDGTDDIANLTTKNYYIEEISNEVENMDTLKNLKHQANGILDRIELLAEKSSKKLKKLAKIAQRDSMESDDNDIEVIKHETLDKNYTQEMNETAEKMVKMKQVNNDKYDSKENMDIESIVLSTLNNTTNNNRTEEIETENTNPTNSNESYNDFDIIDLINQTTTKKQESRRNELKIDIKKQIVEQLSSESDELFESDLADSTEEVFQSDLFPNTKGSNKVLPHRTTNYDMVTRKFIVINDTNRNRNFSFRFNNDPLLFEKSDVLFDELLEEDDQNDNVSVTHKFQKTTSTPTLTKLLNDSRNTKIITRTPNTVIKKYSPQLKKEFIGHYINYSNPTKEYNEADSLEETPTTVASDDRHVSILVYKYKQSLISTATKHLQTTTTTAEIDPKSTLTDIDYDYLLYNYIRDKALHHRTENVTKSIIENLSVPNENPEHDGTFEWNDYNSYDDILSNDESEISNWYKVIPLQIPENKNTTVTNIIALYTHLLPTENHSTTRYPKPKRTAKVRRQELTRNKAIDKITSYSDVLQKYDNLRKIRNVTGKGIFNLKIRRKSTFTLKSTTKHAHMATSRHKHTTNNFNSWVDDNTADNMDYEFLDKPVTEPILEPRDMYLSYDYPYKQRTQINKRNIKSTLYNELFKTQNVTRLVKLICQKNSTNRAYKNMVQRTIYRPERQVEAFTPVGDTPNNAKVDVIITGNNVQNKCLKNIMSVDEENVLPYEHKFLTATSLTEEATEASAITHENQLTTLEKYTEIMLVGKGLSKVKPVLPKLILENNQPPYKHAKYKKKSVIKLGNIWKFMEKAEEIFTTPKSDSTNSKLLVAEAKLTEGKIVNTIKQEPKAIVTEIVSHTTIDPVLSFIKSTAMIHDDTKSVDSNKIGHQPIPVQYEPKANYVPTTVSEFTHIPTSTISGNIYASVTYKLAKELKFIVNVTTETPLLNLWVPITYKNQQFNLNTQLEKGLPTQDIEFMKFLSTKGRSETVSLKPTDLNDPLSTTYLYSKRDGTTSATTAKSRQSNIKPKKRSSVKRSHLWINTIPSFAPHYTIMTQRVTKKPNIINKKNEKHYLTFFAKTTATSNNEEKNIAITNKNRPEHNRLLNLNQNNAINSKEKTGRLGYSILKLHVLVPYTFRKKYVPSATTFTTEEQSESNVEETSTKRTAETNKKQTTESSSATDNPVSTTRQYSKMFQNTLLTIAPILKQSSRVYENTLLMIGMKSKQKKSKHWVHRFLNKYPIIVPRLDNINYLPLAKDNKGGSKIYKHSKNNHPTWVLHFWNNLHEGQKMSTVPTKLDRKLETTAEDAVINFYFKENINKNTKVIPTRKLPILPQNKQIKVVPLGAVKNEALVKEKTKASLKSYDSTNIVYIRITREPNINKANDRLLLREEARAKQMDEYRPLMMKQSTTDSPYEEITEWPTFREEIKWPATNLPFVKPTKESDKTGAYDDFPNYQDLIESLDNEEPELEQKEISTKIRRGLPKSIEYNINNTTHNVKDVNNDDNVEISDEQKEQRLLNDVEKLLRHYFLSSKPWMYIHFKAKTTAATTPLPPSLLSIKQELLQNLRENYTQSHALEMKQISPKLKWLG